MRNKVRKNYKDDSSSLDFVSKNGIGNIALKDRKGWEFSPAISNYELEDPVWYRDIRNKDDNCNENKW